MQYRPFSQRLAQRAGLDSANPTTGGARKGAAVAAGLLWLAAGLSAGYWLLKATSGSQVVALQGLVQSAPQADLNGVARLLGANPLAEPGAAAPAGPLRLLGVISQGAHRGAALIEAQGQPARPIQVGDAVGDGLVLQSVGKKAVQLGETRSGPTTVELVLPVQPAEVTLAQ